MTDEFLAGVPTTKGMQTSDEEALFRLIGEATVAWNSAHAQIFRTFELLSGLTKKKAEAIFFSQVSDRSQREMLKKLATVALVKTPDLSTRLNSICDKLNKKLSGQRNAVIHSFWAWNGQTGKMSPDPFIKPFTGLKLDDYESQIKKLIVELKDVFREILDLQFDILHEGFE